jgi:transposase
LRIAREKEGPRFSPWAELITSSGNDDYSQCFPIVVIQEAGLDGFWIHRMLEAEGIESHVVDPASIAIARRRWRAKADRIDGEALVVAVKPLRVWWQLPPDRASLRVTGAPINPRHS